MKRFAALAAILFLTMTAIPSSGAEGPVRHVVSFKFKAGLDSEKIRDIETSFAALKQKIAVVQQIEWGTDISPEKLSKGFTHCWVLSFKNEADRDAYLVHPDHQAFVVKVKEAIEDAFVFDFIPKE